jgi:protein YIPF1/2
VFVGIGFGVSVAFLLRNLYPVLSATDKQTSKILLVLVVCLHAFLAIFIKVLFFAPGKTPKDSAPDNNGGSTKFFMF